MTAADVPTAEKATSDFSSEGKLLPYCHPANTPLPTPINEEGDITRNFWYIVQNCKEIKNEYAIDPSILIKEECLPPLDDKSGERQNFYLRNDHGDGTVDIELWVDGRRDSRGVRDPKQRTRICVSAQGSVTVKIVRCIRFASGNGRLI